MKNVKFLIQLPAFLFFLSACATPPPPPMPEKTYSNYDEWRRDTSNRSVDISWYLEQVKERGGVLDQNNSYLPAMPKSAVFMLTSKEKITATVNASNAHNYPASGIGYPLGRDFMKWCESNGGLIEHSDRLKKYALLWGQYASSMEDIGYVAPKVAVAKNDVQLAVITCFDKAAWRIGISDRIAEVTIAVPYKFVSLEQQKKNRLDHEIRKSAPGGLYMGGELPPRTPAPASKNQNSALLIIQIDRDLSASKEPFAQLEMKYKEYAATRDAMSAPQKVDAAKDLDRLRGSVNSATRQK